MIDGPFLGAEALTAGLLTRAQLYGTRYRRVLPGVYLPADAPDDLRTRSLAAYLFVRDRGGVLAGYSAALLLGADCAPRQAPAEVLVPHHIPRQPMLRVRYGVPVADDVVEAQGCQVTGPGRAAWDLARRLPITEAVVAVDSLARAAALAAASARTTGLPPGSARTTGLAPGSARITGFVPSELLERRMRNLARATAGDWTRSWPWLIPVPRALGRADCGWVSCVPGCLGPRCSIGSSTSTSTYSPA